MRSNPLTIITLVILCSSALSIHIRGKFHHQLSSTELRDSMEELWITVSNRDSE